MHNDKLLRIGEVAQRTGMTVKTIRYWSDKGLITDVERTHGGLRLYNHEAVLRLKLVRTMRDLKVDFDAIRDAIGRIMTTGGLNRAHDAALTVHIRTLELHRCVLRSVSTLGSMETLDVDLLSRLNDAAIVERRQLTNDFISSLPKLSMEVDPRNIDMLYDLLPQLPGWPRTEHVDAWLKIVELLQDSVLRARLQWAAARQFDVLGGSKQLTSDSYEILARLLHEQLVARIKLSAERSLDRTKYLINEFAVELADPSAQRKPAEFCSWLLTLPEAVSDTRVARYWELTAIIYDRRPPPDPMSSVNRLVAQLKESIDRPSRNETSGDIKNRSAESDDGR